MRTGFKLGLRHLVIFVVVAIVLNAQFTWWIMYSLRQNRERLDVERDLIVTRARSAALEVSLRVEQAAQELMGRVHQQGAPPSSEVFSRIRVVEAETSLPPGALARSPRAGTAAAGGEPGAGKNGGGWIHGESGSLTLVWPVGGGRVAMASLDSGAPRRWLRSIDPAMVLVESAKAGAEPPPVALSAPFEGLSVLPDAARWNQVLVDYQRRVVVVVVEGVVFFAVMVVTVMILWMVMRREGARERQSQNFISAVTHELKTPIAGIRVALETVLGGRVDAEGSEHFLHNALLDAERLSELVEKVLDVTRFAGKARRLPITLGDLSELVEEEVDAASRRARARGVELGADITPGIQAPFDPEAFAIVVSNLLENALKYAQGEPPRVWVTLRLEGGEGVLVVRDNGVGIDAKDIGSIFQPFFRSSDEVTRRTPGTGIGLYVAHEIVTAHGGRLAVASEGRGKGTTFTLVLPGAGELPEEEFSG